MIKIHSVPHNYTIHVSKIHIRQLIEDSLLDSSHNS